MRDIWKRLELEPTQDIDAIKKAYEQKAKTCHPEEDPEGFLALREAYQAALAYASGQPDRSSEPFHTPEPEEVPDEGWTLSGRPRRMAGPNPYADHEAIRQFLELYTGKQRKESQRWLNYFTSAPFLDAAWDWRFTALLLEHVTRLEPDYPVHREFLNWLCVAYRFLVHRAVYRNPDGTERTEFRFEISPNAQFDGQESIFEIAAKGPTPKQPRGNEQAVQISFAEYGYLLSLANQGRWTEQKIGEFSQIIGRYASSYITDKCQQRQDMDYERHPAGLRLMTHFLRRDGLPEELYRVTWQKLDLKTAILGRSHILYGPMRELVLTHLPELAGQKRESFAKLRTDFFHYAVAVHKRNGENAQATPEDIRRTDALFAREDFQRALLERCFVESELLHTWVSETYCDYYLHQVIQFYAQHNAAPCAQQVIQRAQEMLKKQELASRLRKDRETVLPEHAPTLKSGPFFRHWLNTGFYLARDPASGGPLLDYLNRELPYLPEWSRTFLHADGDSITPVSFTRTLDRDIFEVRFHLRYMEFFLNQEPVYRPCIPWERVSNLRDLDLFFFSLPITTATRGQSEPVKAELLRRLAGTAAPEDGREFIAACLADQICALPMPDEVGLALGCDEEDEPPEIRDLPPESVLPFGLFTEDIEHLYGCAWLERQRLLVLFEQFPIGRRILPDGQCDGIADAETAAVMARQMLAEVLNPPHFPVERLTNLPDAVYAKPDFLVLCRIPNAPLSWSNPVELLDRDVTGERLEELLSRCASGQLERLEFSWNIAPPVGAEQDHPARRSLVFLKGGPGYACLYFDDFRAESYALLEKPELYGKEQTTTLVPFRQGKLFRHDIHASFASIRRRLDVIFRQANWPNGIKFMAGGLWDYAVNVTHGRTKYNLDKQLLADFPMERANNRSDAAFYFPTHPDSAACVDEQGTIETLEVSALNRDRLQQMMIRFLDGAFAKLRLTWGKTADRRRHIILLHDSGRFLMVWLMEDKRTAEYHVADVYTYMDVEGKKYPKDTFQGRVTPAYLIHDGVTPLRNALELLLAHLDNPSIVTGKMAEYAGEKPYKPRPYTALWAELVGDTLGSA